MSAAKPRCPKIAVTVEVTGARSNAQAATAILMAFALRQPDGFSFRIKTIRRIPEARQ